MHSLIIAPNAGLVTASLSLMLPENSSAKSSLGGADMFPIFVGTTGPYDSLCPYTNCWCMYVCMYVCYVMCICMYVCMYVMCMYMYVCVFVGTTGPYDSLCPYVCMYVYMYVYVCMYV